MKHFLSLNILRKNEKKEKVNDIRKDMEDQDENEKLRIANLPRFTGTDINFLNKKIRIVDIASFNFIKKEIFDQQIYKFQATATEEPYIIDCGANIGLSIIYFKQLYPNAEIVGFEPDDKVFRALEQNIKSFNFSNVQLIQKACWNEETTLKFYSEGADGGRVAKDFDTDQIIDVQTIRLIKFLNRKVDFLKIDIEGAETKVLEDCTDLLCNVEKIFVEYHSYLGVEQSLEQLLRILKNAGFRYSIQQHGVVSQNPFITIDHQNQMDILLNISGYRNY
jgi:FkbM family methyltransferase